MGSICLDSHPGRVTVILEEDGRTIKEITQEVVFNAFGGHSGEDLRKALLHQKQHGSLNGYEHYRGSYIFVNDKALKELDFDEKQ